MLRRFFQDYKQLEGKAVEVDEIRPAAEAFPIIMTPCTGIASSDARVSEIQHSTEPRGSAGILPAVARATRAAPLPDPAGVLPHHRLARLAAARLLELRHVLHHAVDAVLARRVRVGR